MCENTLPSVIVLNLKFKIFCRVLKFSCNLNTESEEVSDIGKKLVEIVNFYIYSKAVEPLFFRKLHSCITKICLHFDDKVCLHVSPTFFILEARSTTNFAAVP